MLLGAPKAKDFARCGDIEINRFHAALHKFIADALKEAKKYFALKKLQTAIPSKDDDEME